MGKIEIVNRPRQAGKTTEAIKKAHETGAYIICKNREMAQWISHRAEEMGTPIRFPITWEEFLSSDKMKSSYVKNVVIDNADDLFLSMFTGLKIEMITLDMNKR